MPNREPEGPTRHKTLCRCQSKADAHCGTETLRTPILRRRLAPWKHQAIWRPLPCVSSDRESSSSAKANIRFEVCYAPFLPFIEHHSLYTSEVNNRGMSALDKVITLTAQVCAFHPKTRPSADPYPLRVRGASERLGIYFTFSRISTTLCSVNSVNASKRMVSKQATESGLNILRAGSPGRRQAVLFIHGWACQAADYTALIDQISQQDDKLQDTFTSHLRNLDQPFADALRKTHIAFDHERMSAALTEVGRQGTPFFSLQSTDCDEQNRRRPVRQGEETRWMRFLRDRIPQVEIVLVERAGHFPHVDQTDTVAKVMKVWVGDVLARDEGGKVIAAKV
ncbi:hypothetical protein M8818_007130 [Zalaria obscura]|uniref:Uncharacterized protein n=1 Tax=Zalaria obscura TaxID=2024903 RepID=A0ACC3S729_9PEZI